MLRIISELRQQRSFYIYCIAIPTFKSVFLQEIGNILRAWKGTVLDELMKSSTAFHNFSGGS